MSNTLPGGLLLSAADVLVLARKLDVKGTLIKTWTTGRRKGWELRSYPAAGWTVWDKATWSETPWKILAPASDHNPA
jgi:hypothetical protein